MRTIGIDLAITGKHQAVIADDRGNAVGQPWRFCTSSKMLDELSVRAREGAAPDEPLRVIMEPTGLMWLPVACYLVQRKVEVYLVNAHKVAQWRKCYRQYAQSDRISARVLARLPWIDSEALHRLHLADRKHLSGQRLCKEKDRLTRRMTELKNQIRAAERAFWPGLEQVVGDLFAPWVCAWRARCYDPWRLKALSQEETAAVLRESAAPPKQVDTLAKGLQEVASATVALYDPDGRGTSLYVDYTQIQEEVARSLQELELCATQAATVRQKILALYQQVDPERTLESLRGVGAESAAVYHFFIGDVQRFASQKDFRSWSGMIPTSAQSGSVEQKGLHLTKAGPSMIKRYAFLDAEVARRYDPQIAAIYYDQMMHKGKHHLQAVCCCATHLLDRVRAVLNSGDRYTLRDVDGRAVDTLEAQRIVAERYRVPEEVRKRRRQRARKEQRDQRAESQTQRRSRRRTQETDTVASPQPVTAAPA